MRQTKRGRRWLLRGLLLLVLLCVCGVSVVLLYGRWLGSDVLAGDGSDLGAVQRLYLQYYLSNHAQALQQPAGVGETAVDFTVAPGETADAIAANLVDAQLLNDQELFLNYIRFYGLDAEIEAGEFLLSPQATIPELAQALTDAAAQALTLRFIEGWRVGQMADYLAQNQVASIDTDDFLAIVERRLPFDLSRYDFLTSHPPDATLEGFLFPDTYHVPPEADAAFVVDMMLRNFGNRVTPAMRQAYGTRGLSLREAVTLASIIEREAVVPAERPLMAGVFFNRMAQGIKLQADPTIQYALGYQSETGQWWKSPLSQADLELDHPYNTYVYAGLPPGPIANPGLASLQAVAEPAQTEFIFFVVDCTAGDGSHLFSVTYEEHLSNVQRCR